MPHNVDDLPAREDRDRDAGDAVLPGHSEDVRPSGQGNGARALIFDYRLAPEHIHPAQLDDATDVYERLLDQGISADQRVHR